MVYLRLKGIVWYLYRMAGTDVKINASIYLILQKKKKKLFCKIYAIFK